MSHHELEARSTTTTISTASFSTWRRRTAPIWRRRVRAAMALDGVLRIKGRRRASTGKAAPLVVQAVGPARRDLVRRPMPAAPTGLVVIGLKGLDRDAVERRWLREPDGAMHLLTGQPRGIDGEAEPPSISASRRATSSSSPPPTPRSPGWRRRGARWARTFPSVRLANWMRARASLFGRSLWRAGSRRARSSSSSALLGGASYWPYGLDEAVAASPARGGTKLAVLPGDATWDAALAADGTVPLGAGAQALVAIWSRAARRISPTRSRYARASDRAGRGAAGAPSRCRRAGLLSVARRRRERWRDRRPAAADRLLPRAPAGRADRAGRCALRGAGGARARGRCRSSSPA